MIQYNILCSPCLIWNGTGVLLLPFTSIKDREESLINVIPSRLMLTGISRPAEGFDNSTSNAAIFCASALLKIAGKKRNNKKYFFFILMFESQQEQISGFNSVSYRRISCISIGLFKIKFFYQAGNIANALEYMFHKNGI